MGRIVIVVYRPYDGKEDELLELVREHLPLLKSQDLITDRPPIVMQAADRSIVEIFEWQSAHAIAVAHEKPAVRELWRKFDKVCSYERPVSVSEFHNLFSEFEPIN